MLAGPGSGVFAEDEAELRGRGEATRGGDVFELSVRGAEQGMSADSLKPSCDQFRGTVAFINHQQNGGFLLDPD